MVTCPESKPNVFYKRGIGELDGKVIISIEEKYSGCLRFCPINSATLIFGWK